MGVGIEVGMERKTGWTKEGAPREQKAIWGNRNAKKTGLLAMLGRQAEMGKLQSMTEGAYQKRS